MEDFLYAVPTEFDCYCHQGETYDGGGDGLVFAVAVGVVFVCGLAAESYECDYDDIGDEVAERMYGVCYHRGGVADDACCKLEYEEEGVDDAACEGDAVHLLLACGWHGDCVR